MPKTFQLNATLNVAGVTGLNKISSQIRSSLASVNGNINVKVSAQATSAISSLNARLNVLNRTLSTTNTNTRNLAAAFRQLGAAANFNTGNLTKFNAQLQQLYKINTSLAKNTNSTRDAFEKLGASAGQAIKRFASYTIAASAIGGLSAATFSAVREALEFERELVKVSQVTGKTVSGLSNLTKTVTTLSTSLGVSSKGLITTAQILAQAGLSAKDTTIALTALAKTELSPTFDDINETTEGSIAIMRQFGVEAKDLEKRLSSLNAVSGQFAVESADLITAVRRAGGAFKAAGGTFDEFIALFTSIRQTTRESAESIATGFRTIFARLQRPATIKYLEELGIQLSNLDGKFVGPFEAVRRLQEGLAKLDSTDIRFAQVIEELGGFRQISKVIPLIQQFAVSERALQVSLRGTDTLTQDAASAQQSLLIQLTKVKEEFVNLFRIVTNNTAFRSLIQLTLELTKSLTQLAKTFEPILPLLAVIGVQKAQGAGSKFLKGFLGRNEGGPVQKFARGGLVPGQGSGDTVPAMLEAGEFVIRKNAVKKLGLSKLDTLNRYNTGGEAESKITLPASLAKLFKKQLPNYNVATGRQVTLEQLASFGVPTEATAKQAGVIKGLVSGIPTQKKSKQPTKQKKPNTLLSQQFGMISLIPNTETPDFISHIPASLIAQKSKNKLNKSNIISSLGGKGKYDASVKTGNLGESTSALLKNVLFKNVVDGFTSGASQIGSKIGVSPNLSNNAINSTFGKIGGTNLVGRLFEGVLTLLNNGPFKADSQANLDFPSGINGPLSKTFAGFKNLPSDAKYQNDESSRSSMRGKIATFLAKNIAGFANGGLSGDTVPAMLTPGEYVINKKAANRIGMSTLNKLNKADRVQGFASGGPVNQGGGLGGIGLGGLLLFLPQLTGLMGDFGTEMTSLLFTVSLLTKELNLFSSGGLGSFKKSLNTFGDELKGLFNPSGSKIGVSTLKKEALAAAKASILVSGSSFADRRLAINTQRQNLANSSLVNNKTRSEAFGRIANRGLGASLGVGLLGGVISSRANTNINNGATDDFTKVQAAGGGLLSGAAIGATVGAAFGPVGIAIGALGGAAISATKAFIDAEKQMASVKFEKSFEKFNNAIELVTSGKSTASIQSSTLRRGIEESQNRLLTAEPEEAKALANQLRAQAVNIEIVNRQLLAGVKTEDEFQRILNGTNKSLFKFQSELLDIPFDKLVSNMRSQIASELNRKKIVDAVASSMANLNSDILIFNERIAAASTIGLALENLSSQVDFITSGFTNKSSNTNKQVVELASEGKLALLAPFEKLVNQIAPKQEAKQAVDAARVIQQLPAILTESLASSDNNQFANIVDKRLSALNIDKNIQSLIRNSVDNLSGGEQGEGEVKSDIKTRVNELTVKLTEGLKPFFDVISKNIELENQFNSELDKIFNARIESENRLIDFNKKARSLDFSGRKEIADITGKPLSNASIFNEARRVQQESVNGLNVNANNPAEISNAIVRMRNVITGLESQISNTRDLKVLAGLNNQLAYAKDAAKNLAGALDNLTDVSKLGADAIRDEINTRENTRGFKLDFIENVLTNTFEDNVGLAKNVGSLGKARQQNSLEGIGQEQRGGLFNLLKQIGNVKLDFLGGKSGDETRQEIIKGEMQRLFNAGQLPQGTTQRDINSLSAISEQDPLVQQLKSLHQITVDAANKQAELQGKLVTSLETTIPTQLTDIIKLFGEAQKVNAENAKRRAETDKLEDNKKKLETAQAGGTLRKVFGVNRLGAKELDAVATVKASLPEILKRQELINKNKVIQAASIKPANFDSLLKNDVLRAKNTPQEINKFIDANTQLIEAVGINKTDLRTKISENGLTTNSIKKVFEELINNARTKSHDEIVSSEAAISNISNGDKNVGLLIEQLSSSNKNDNNILIKAIQNEIGGELNANLTALNANIDALTKAIENSPVGKARGGLIYKAAGGSIFKPRGTDTVPAMLTPGEFVVNARSTSQNLGLLQGINAGYYADGGKITPNKPNVYDQDYYDRLKKEMDAKTAARAKAIQEQHEAEKANRQKQTAEWHARGEAKMDQTREEAKAKVQDSMRAIEKRHAEQNAYEDVLRRSQTMPDDLPVGENGKTKPAPIPDSPAVIAKRQAEMEARRKKAEQDVKRQQEQDAANAAEAEKQRAENARKYAYEDSFGLGLLHDFFSATVPKFLQRKPNTNTQDGVVMPESRLERGMRQYTEIKPELEKLTPNAKWNEMLPNGPPLFNVPAENLGATMYGVSNSSNLYNKMGASYLGKDGKPLMNSSPVQGVTPEERKRQEDANEAMRRGQEERREQEARKNARPKGKALPDIPMGGPILGRQHGLKFSSNPENEYNHAAGPLSTSPFGGGISRASGLPKNSPRRLYGGSYNFTTTLPYYGNSTDKFGYGPGLPNQSPEGLKASNRLSADDDVSQINEYAKRRARGLARGAFLKGDVGATSPTALYDKYLAIELRNIRGKTDGELNAARIKRIASGSAKPLGLAKGGLVGGTQYLAGGGQASPAGGSFDFSVFSNAVLEFGKSSSQLIEAMNSFPRSITIQGQHTQNIIINGGQVFEGIKEQLGSLIESRISDHINSLVTDRLPGSGPAKPTNLNRNG